MIITIIIHNEQWVNNLFFRSSAQFVTIRALLKENIIYNTLSVSLKGIGPGREQALRGLQGAGFDFDTIVDNTPIPHGGCRPKRRRRV